MRRRLAVLGILAFVASTPVARAAEFDFSMLAGGTVPLLSDSGQLVGGDPDTKTTMSPFVSLDIDAPISTFTQGPVLAVGVELGALPGESLTIEQPESYRSLRLVVGLAQSLTTKLNFGLYAECGFATRLAGDTQPRDKAPRWCGAGLRFKTKDGAELIVTGNADQRLSSTADLPAAPSPPGTVQTLAYQGTLGLRGRIAIFEKKDGMLKGGKVSLYGSAILGLDLSKRSPTLTGGRHDVVNVGIAIGV